MLSTDEKFLDDLEGYLDDQKAGLIEEAKESGINLKFDRLLEMEEEGLTKEDLLKTMLVLQTKLANLDYCRLALDVVDVYKESTPAQKKALHAVDICREDLKKSCMANMGKVDDMSTIVAMTIKDEYDDYPEALELTIETPEGYDKADMVAYKFFENCADALKFAHEGMGSDDKKYLDYAVIAPLSALIFPRSKVSYNKPVPKKE